MKGGIIMVVGVILMIIVFIMFFAIVVCTTSANEDAFYCVPLSPLTDMAARFF